MGKKRTRCRQLWLHRQRRENSFFRETQREREHLSLREKQINWKVCTRRWSILSLPSMSIWIPMRIDFHLSFTDRSVFVELISTTTRKCCCSSEIMPVDLKDVYLPWTAACGRCSYWLFFIWRSKSWHLIISKVRKILFILRISRRLFLWKTF